MQIRSFIAATALVTGLAAQENGAASTGPQQVEVGARPEYSFQQPLYNGRGLTSLADLRGKPVIIEFWGVR